MKEWRRYALLALTTAGVLVFLFIKIGPSASQLAAPDWRWALAAGSLTLLFPFCMAVRWGAVLRAAGHRIGWRQATAITMAAWPLGSLTPAKVGDLAKAYCIRDRVPLSVGLGSVVAERAVDVVVLLLFSLGGALWRGWTSIALFAAAGIAAALAGWAVCAFGFRLPIGEKWSSKLALFGECARALLRNPRWLAVSAAASGLNWLLSIVQAWWLYRAYGESPDFATVCAALPASIFVGLLPLTLAGMGTRDAALIVLMKPYAAESASFGVGILYSVFGHWAPALVGLFFMKRMFGFSVKEMREGARGVRAQG